MRPQHLELASRFGASIRSLTIASSTTGSVSISPSGGTRPAGDLPAEIARLLDQFRELRVGRRADMLDRRALRPIAFDHGASILLEGRLVYVRPEDFLLVVFPPLRSASTPGSCPVPFRDELEIPALHAARFPRPRR